MIQLMIRMWDTAPWMEAVLPTEFSYDITVDNTYFTSSGEYSKEIELPLKNCAQNLKIFGHMNRLDVRRRKKAMDARLLENYKPLLVGSVTVLECDDKVVKVQLLGNNASVNFKNKFNELYIDQLDLGSVFEGHNIRIDYNDNRSSIVVNNLDSFKNYIAVFNAYWTMDINDVECIYGSYDNGFVILPAVDDFGEVVNRRAFISYRSSTNPTDRKLITRHPVVFPGRIARFKWNGTPPVADFNNIVDIQGVLIEGKAEYCKGPICPQPYIDTVVNRVIKALGFTITLDMIKKGRFAKTYVPSTTETEWINEMLPHWTVNDFLEEIEKFFGVFFIFDEEKKECRIERRGQYFEKIQPKHLKMVDDVFTTSFDDENMVDMSYSNVSFALENDIHNIKKEITKKAIIEIYDFYSYEAMVSSISGETTIFGNKASKVIAERDGRQYILYTGKVMEINELRDYRLNDDNSDNEITLKIKPALMEASNILIIDSDYAASVAYEKKDGTQYGEMKPKNYPTPCCPVYGKFNDDFNVADAIEYGLDTNNKEDYLPVAILNVREGKDITLKFTLIGIQETTFKTLLSWGSTFGEDTVSEMAFEGPQELLRLNHTKGYYTLYDSSIDIGLKIVGQTATKINFYDDEIPQQDSFFIFNGKKYCSKKIEYTFTNNGISKIKTGYFYNVE